MKTVTAVLNFIDEIYTDRNGQPHTYTKCVALVDIGGGEIEEISLYPNKEDKGLLKSILRKVPEVK